MATLPAEQSKAWATETAVRWGISWPAGKGVEINDYIAIATSGDLRTSHGMTLWSSVYN